MQLGASAEADLGEHLRPHLAEALNAMCLGLPWHAVLTVNHRCCLFGIFWRWAWWHDSIVSMRCDGGLVDTCRRPDAEDTTATNVRESCATRAKLLFRSTRALEVVCLVGE